MLKKTQIFQTSLPSTLRRNSPAQWCLNILSLTPLKNVGSLECNLIKVSNAKVWGVTVFMTYYGVCLNKYINQIWCRNKLCKQYSTIDYKTISFFRKINIKITDSYKMDECDSAMDIMCNFLYMCDEPDYTLQLSIKILYINFSSFRLNY